VDPLALALAPVQVQVQVQEPAKVLVLVLVLVLVPVLVLEPVQAGWAFPEALARRPALLRRFASQAVGFHCRHHRPPGPARRPAAMPARHAKNATRSVKVRIWYEFAGS
jgi:hypothetical protein